MAIARRILGRRGPVPAAAATPIAAASWLFSGSSSGRMMTLGLRADPF